MAAELKTVEGSCVQEGVGELVMWAIFVLRSGGHVHVSSDAEVIFEI